MVLGRGLSIKSLDFNIFNFFNFFVLTVIFSLFTNSLLFDAIFVQQDLTEENLTVVTKKLKISKSEDFIENPRPRTKKYVPKLFLSQWRHYLDTMVDLKKVPKLRFSKKNELFKNSIKQ